MKVDWYHITKTPEVLQITRDELAEVVVAVEKYTREHIVGHITNDGSKACLFNAGSERDLMMEDVVWKTASEGLVASTTSLLWHLGFEANHGEE